MKWRLDRRQTNGLIISIDWSKFQLSVLEPEPDNLQMLFRNTSWQIFAKNSFRIPEEVESPRNDLYHFHYFVSVDSKTFLTVNNAIYFKVWVRKMFSDHTPPSREGKGGNRRGTNETQVFQLGVGSNLSIVKSFS